MYVTGKHFQNPAPMLRFGLERKTFALGNLFISPLWSASLCVINILVTSSTSWPFNYMQSDNHKSYSHCKLVLIHHVQSHWNPQEFQYRPELHHHPCQSHSFGYLQVFDGCINVFNLLTKAKPCFMKPCSIFLTAFIIYSDAVWSLINNWVK